ncbi:hypothetical protein Enr10x_25230 [Gimesia panareensis]|uniref:Lipoprotein n=2 Tax=Gimesia panareensis TaxID=2527978 RepID=A0A517Q6H9_9PLAN|nr:hypothetical protein Enr10x_25230 [Gimesia panareensis]
MPIKSISLFLDSTVGTVLVLTRILTLLIGLSSLTGCVIMRTTVTNPNPRLKTVAVVPFFNLSQEPDVDGRRFALAYYSELQKIPGFQVLPVGVAEVAMVEHQLQMNNPDDVLKLAKALDVDAVVIGAVTDYSPYYPPRIGLQVSWYSPHAQEFTPGVPLLVEERHEKKSILNQLFKVDRIVNHETKKEIRYSNHLERKNTRQEMKEKFKAYKESASAECPPGIQAPEPKAEPVFRGQSVETLANWSYTQNQNQVVHASTQANQGAESTNPFGQVPLQAKPPAPLPVTNKTLPAPQPTATPQPTTAPLPASTPSATPSYTKQFGEFCPPNGAAQIEVYDPRQPFMSYTRMFDGSEAALVANLRDYLEVSGDRRSGGWEAYLHRSEDFIRFTAHLMIVEMLTLHGGQAERQMIFKVRKYR